MSVSDVILGLFACAWWVCEEARKKRPFFSEDIIDSNSLFHSCLLTKLDRGLLSIDHKRWSTFCCPSSNKTKTLHPHQGRRVTPRYHPELRLQVYTFSYLKLPTSLVRYNGLSREGLLCSPAAFTLPVSLSSDRRVRSQSMCSRWALCWALTSLSQLADGMTYYSCPDILAIG